MALGLWFGESDFLKTVNIIAGAADFSDADCNAANAGAVIGAMRGLDAIPAHLVAAFNDRIYGARMGPVVFRKPVEEKISDVAARTARLGCRIAGQTGETIEAARAEPVTQPLEKFTMDDYGPLWDPAWRLERAGRGGIGGGRGATYLDGATLVTFPRDEVRRCYLWREVQVEKGQALRLEVAAEAQRAWRLAVYADNRLLLERIIEGRTPQVVHVSLDALNGQTVTLRLYQDTLLAGRLPSPAYWLKAEVR